MCDVGSRRIMPDGMILFVTDKDVNNYMNDNPSTTKTWPDFGGHSGIDLIYPGTRGRGKDEELFPLPPLMAEAVNRGELDELNRKAHNCWFRVNKKGNREGLCESWHDNGKRAVKTMYKDGKEHGPYERWHDNGKQEVKATYNNGKLHGPCESWYDNGKQEVKAMYKDNNLHGPYESWHDNGKPWVKVMYRDGNRHGPCESWYDNGKRAVKATYKDGVRVEDDK